MNSYELYPILFRCLLHAFFELGSYLIKGAINFSDRKMMSTCLSL
jgi:hypothetical protein